MDKKELVKRRGRDYLIVALIAVASIMTFIGGYSLSDSFKSPYREVVKEEEEPDITRGRTNYSVLGFDKDYIIDVDKDADYSLKSSTYGLENNTDYYIYTVHGLVKNEVEFVKSYYDSKEDERLGVVKFDSDVVDVYLYGSDKLLFLLADGTVEYVELSEVNLGSSIKHEEIAALKNTAKFYTADVCKTEVTEEGRNYSCRLGQFAQLITGEIYDLSNIDY